ncbi:MAG: DNA polymerase III subunit beta [Proteobacteria bacterium]|nr:DNA polymerase III subunit beta [SAR86 cluster bacterium]MDA0344342.1 DNA polymerase III subunit beta [Pseudomonadota bacterium]MDA0899642.1 DNA polymerase III subunit beta [Pseudomonadota bacterium]MDA1056526.1 DNA polymerase III subunit beta [Pseudomonadota bacterium]
MKLSINKEQIINQLQSLAAVADKKQTLPILSNILIRADEEVITLKSTDLEVELEFVIPNKNQTPGEITIPAKKISDIIKELPDGQIDFELNDDASKLLIKSSSGRYNLSTISASDFPDFDVVKSDQTYNIPSESFINLIQKTSFAMANQDWRHYLNGCLFQKSLNDLVMVATDAHRLATYIIPLEQEGEFSGIIPRKSVIELLKILPKSNENISFYINTNNIVFMSKNFTFKSKLVDGNYPNYNQVIPAGEGLEITIERKKLLDTLSRVSVLSSEKFKGVKLCTKGESLEVSAHNPEQESAEELVPLVKTAEGFDIAFNVNYLREVLSSIEDENISMVSFGPDKSAIIKSSDLDQTLVLMPLLL